MKDEASRREKPNEIGFALRQVGFMYQAAAARNVEVSGKKTAPVCYSSPFVLSLTACRQQL